MKPSFALDFRDGLVTLLHRTSRGWSQVGSVAYDAPDFAEALGYMRSTALGLSPRGITTKLIIPNEQILYTTVHAPGPDAAKRKRQIKAGLEGQTPYAVDDLVYDWWGTGPDLNVAVLARETLAEAEAFAAEHRFNPVSFAAVPDNGSFLGEPFFGPTALSSTLLAEGEKVERDTDPVTIIARDFPRTESKPEPKPAPVSAPVAAAELPAPEPLPAESEPEPLQVEDVADGDLTADPADDVAADPGPAKAKPATLPEPVNVAAPVIPAPVHKPGAETTSAQPRVPAEMPAAVAMRSAEKTASPDVGKADLPPSTKLPPQPVPVPEAPMAMDVGTEQGLATDSDLSTFDDVPPSPAAEIVSAFASRRTAAIAAATAGAAKPAGASKIPAVGPAPAQRPTVSPTVPRPTLARPAAAAGREPVAFPTRTAAAPAKPQIGKSGKMVGASVTAPGILGAKRERNVVALPTAAAADGQDPGAARRPAAAKPPTGLGSRSAPIKGKPRYLGLVLTVLLLVLLAAVAAWSSFFMGATDTTGTGAGTGGATTNASASLSAPAENAAENPAVPDATAATATAQPPAEPATETATSGAAPTDTAATDTATAETAANDTAAIDTAAANGAAANGAAADTASLQAALPLTSTPDPAVPDTSAPATTAAAVPEPAVPVVEPSPQTEVSTTSVAPVVPATTVLDRIVLASADTPPNPKGPQTLPVAAAGADASPAAEPPPPPYGTVYKFDADGRIIPTPEGIITPEGVLLIAGKPSQIPPGRPAELTPAAPAVVAPQPLQVALPAPLTDAAPGTVPTLPPSVDGTTAATTDPAAVIAPAAPALAPEPVISDPTLADKRPKDRPANLAPSPDQQGALAAPSAEDLRLAALHPQARPAGLPAPAAPDATADAAQPAATEQPAAAASLAANGFALRVSPKPQARPSGLDRAVDTAVQDALNQTAPEAQPETKVASNEPAAQPEPEPQAEAPAPNLPTNASVAKQATMRHALNTNKVALLAVFGTPSTRFAMIRQGNGAVKKVKVGDALDGGRIAAITESSVQYQKGGRIVTLSLPAG